MEQPGQPEELSGQEKANLSGEVMESLGESEPETHESEGTESKQGTDPLYVQKRLKRAERNHQRELRAMQQQIQDLHARIGQPNGPHTEPPMNPYTNQPPQAVSEDERIARAVRYAREQDKADEQKRLDGEKMAHVSKQYQKLQDNLDKAHDKYEDFHDVVMRDDVPFTPHMRDAVLLLGDDHQADVLYKLAKNPDELARISKLHPLDQAKEVVKLSHALMGGSGTGKSQPSPHRPLGQVKSTPIVSSSVSDKTPASEIRARMKAGTWK